MKWRILKFLAGLFVVALIVGCSALLATVYATRQISMALRQSMAAPESQLPPEIEHAVSLDFCKSAGIDPSELRDWFRELDANHHMQQVRVLLTLHNQKGHCLVNSPVGLKWKDGIDWYHIDSSGVAEFAMSAAQLEDLMIVTPAEYTELHQRTFPLGTQYEKPPQISDFAGVKLVIHDDAIQQDLLRHLLKVRGVDSVFERLQAEKTMRRPVYDVELPEPSGESQSPDQIYELRSRSVVVIGFLQPNGQISQGTGFVLSSTGVIATNFHVVDKPDAVAAGVLMADHSFYEIQEFLAGSPSDDLALVRVAASDLPPIPLAPNNALVGSGLLAITHPQSHYFSMTSGQSTRYFLKTRHAMPSLRMGVTADFSEGSSGGPLLDSFGNVVGVVSATMGNQNQMLQLEAIPVSSLRRLSGHSPEHSNAGDEAPVTPGSVPKSLSTQPAPRDITGTNGTVEM
ncbi:MAG TPA: serine protease [Planctomycetaceae bacterium]|nr:serine protease [Planctomycetaceae bacterium]